MSTPMKRYKESLEETARPISLSELEYAYDISGAFAYAKSKGVPFTSLSEEEKKRFIVKRNA